MIIGVLTVDVVILESQSLKDKRRVIQSVKHRLRDKFNVSVAEIEFGDSPKRCRLGVALIDRETRAIHAQLDKMVELIRHTGGLTLLEYHRELL
jgi:hypothetical protein